MPLPWLHKCTRVLSKPLQNVQIESKLDALKAVSICIALLIGVACGPATISSDERLLVAKTSQPGGLIQQHNVSFGDLQERLQASLKSQRTAEANVEALKTQSKVRWQVCPPLSNCSSIFRLVFPLGQSSTRCYLHVVSFDPGSAVCLCWSTSQWFVDCMTSASLEASVTSGATAEAAVPIACAGISAEQTEGHVLIT